MPKLRQPDPTIAFDFLTETRIRCQDSNRSTSQPSSQLMESLEMNDRSTARLDFAWAMTKIPGNNVLDGSQEKQNKTKQNEALQGRGTVSS
uniref:Uncharacterized protein n=1 Tax=Quercus lobata TaxID=97700 RepID=A0A7N2LJA1_QUELO